MTRPRTRHITAEGKGTAAEFKRRRPRRAEANAGLGNVTDAADDINFIRTTSGGLAARTDITAANVLDAVLKEKWFSLLFEGGHRWIDMRRYGKLGDLPLAVPSHQVNAMFPIPEAETLARQGS